MISNCCKAQIELVNGYEGTSFYRCGECGEACDPYRPTKEDAKEAVASIVKIVQDKDARLAAERAPRRALARQLMELYRDFEQDTMLGHKPSERDELLTFTDFMEWVEAAMCLEVDA